MSAILSARGLEKTFGPFVAAHNISCEIGRGEVVGIIGANGAGKTTFVNMISGHLVPTKGAISFDGRDITGLASRKIMQLGIGRSFQIAQVFATLTAFENLCIATAIARFGGALSALSIHRMMSADIVRGAETSLTQFGIAEHRDNPANTLSQGERKILDVAMAAAGNPSLILLDEPTSGVSREERHGLMHQIMTALKERGATVLFVEHDMEVVSAHARRVLAFIDGTIVADDTPQSVFARADVRVRITGDTKIRVDGGAHA